MKPDPRIREILRRQFRIHMAEAARAREDRYYALAAMCDSPIERLLLAPLMFMAPRCLHPSYSGPADLPGEGRLHAQYNVGGYRLDFAYIVTPIKEPPLRVGIECDGHEFHASREQREHDATRQMALRGHGFELIRFTGSQINRDPELCAQQVADTVDRMWAQRVTDQVAANHNHDDGEAA